MENSKKNKKIPYMIKNKSTSEVTNNVQEMYKEFFYTSYFKRKRLVRTVLIFTESSDQLSRATDRV
ncbi:recombinase, partial [Escherichia coli]